MADKFEIPEELKIFAIWNPSNEEDKNNLEPLSEITCGGCCRCGCPGGLQPGVIRSMLRSLRESE